MIIIDCNTVTNKEREIAERVVQWCIDNVIKCDIDINMEICKYKTYKCWGTCEEVIGGYNITIANDQTIRGFVATITHEMVHVKQYLTGKWQCDGEKECERLQYKLADKIWKKGLI